MKKGLKLAIIISTLITTLVTTGIVLAVSSESSGPGFLEFSREKGIFQIGETIKANNEIGASIVVAYIEGEPIYQDEVNLKKLINEISYEYMCQDSSLADAVNAGVITLQAEQEIICDIAKFRLVAKEVENAGISITREEAIKKLRESQEKVKRLAEAGFEDRAQAVELDRIFLAGLGMTEEEYILGIGSQLTWESMVKKEFLSLHYDEELRKKRSDSSYEPQNHSDFLDELLQNADLNILQEEQRKSK